MGMISHTFGKTVLAVCAGMALLSAPACAAEEREKANFPETDIFLFDLVLGDEVSISGGKNVTARIGYDNQPAFTPDSKTFLYSRADEYQTDVYEYDLAAGTSKQITFTDTFEFSPIASPDNKTISFVTDGVGANQNINYIARNRVSKLDKLLPGSALREPVGYYSWDHTNGNVLFWSRYGYNITLASKDSETTHYVTGNAIPATPYIIPGTYNFSFVHRQANDQMWIKELNPKTKAVRPLTPTPGSNANYGWAPDGSILIIEKDVLYRWKENATKGWEKVDALSEYGIKGAARLNVSPDGKKLAIVGVSAAD